MRKLTIKRRKTMVASLMKVKIYIDEDTNPELFLCGYGCRKIGELKNNSEMVLEIDHNEHIVFADVAMQLTDAFVDMVSIPAGEQDLVLSGKNVFSPFKGNPFVFDKL